MVVTIHNISEVLEIIETLKTDDGNTNLDAAKKLFYQRGIQVGTARINFEENFNFCKFSSLLEIEGKKVWLNDKAKKFINESIDEKKKILREQCAGNTKLFNEIIGSISKFDFINGEYSCPMDKVNEKLSGIEDWFDILYDIDFLIKKPETDIVKIDSDIIKMAVGNTEKIRILSILQKKPIPLSKQLENKEKEERENKITGEIAEDIVLKSEIRRLQQQGFSEESKKVKQISIDNSNAGYDIISFLGKAENLEIPDKFIEVKGTTTNSFRFFWSKNEIEVAQELKENYWIYFVTNIDKDKKTGEIKEIIKDPFSKIFFKDEFKRKCQSYEITKN